MKNSNLSGILASMLALAACGDDGHDTELADASQDEVTGDAGSSRSNSNGSNTSPAGGTSLIDLIGGLFGSADAGAGLGIDLGSLCGAFPQVCQGAMGTQSEMDAGRGGPNTRDAGPDAGSPDAGLDAAEDEPDADVEGDAESGEDAALADGAADSAADDASADGADADPADDDGDAASDDGGRAEDDADAADGGEQDAEAEPPAS